MQTIVLLGAGGQLGKKIAQDFKAFYNVISLDRNKCDIANSDALENIFKYHHPSIVINCAAYTNVDSAEDDFKKCLSINFSAVKVLAELSNKFKYKLIHFSTDYVFNAKNNRPIREDDLKEPINAYGLSKLKGENAIENIAKDFYIFRTSWVYSNDGSNFPKKILSLAKNNEILNIVNDQFGSPTSVDLISYLVLLSLKNNIKNGIYHISSSGLCTWFDIALEILEFTQKKTFYSLKNILPVSSLEFKSKAMRPTYSYLDNTKIKESLGVEIKNWRVYFNKFLIEEKE